MSAWLVRLPGRAEARYLAGEHGPFRPDRWGRRPPGQVEILVGDRCGSVWVRLDGPAFDSLAHLGSIDGYADGRITFPDGPVMHIGGADCPLTPDDTDTAPDGLPGE